MQKAGEKVTFDPKDVYDFKLGATLDEKVLLKKFGPAMDKKREEERQSRDHQHRSYRGTILGAEITRKFGTSLEPDTYTVQCKGAGGQSFGAFIPKGLTLELEAIRTITSERPLRRKTGCLPAESKKV